MLEVFLSASVPSAQRDPRFYKSADVLAIRESVKALVEIILPIGRLTCGGHPAITPLLALFVREAGMKSDRVTIFQSELFRMEYPPELSEFVNVRIVAKIEEDREKSLRLMRDEMLTSRVFNAGIFIGGMEGVLDEATMFAEKNPKAKILPVATTGAAAAELYEAGDYPKSLGSELTYTTLFRRLLLPTTREA